MKLDAVQPHDSRFAVDINIDAFQVVDDIL